MRRIELDNEANLWLGKHPLMARHEWAGSAMIPWPLTTPAQRQSLETALESLWESGEPGLDDGIVLLPDGSEFEFYIDNTGETK